MRLNDAITVVRFMLIGPFIGAMTAFVILAIQGSSPRVSVEANLAFMLLLLKVSYSLARLPAALTGGVAAWLNRRQLSHAGYIAAVTSVGAALSVVLLSTVIGGGRPSKLVEAVLLIGSIGAAAALGCALVELWLKRLGSAKVT